MPDLRKLYKTLKSNAPDYIKESEQDFVNKWKGSEDKLYDQLSSEVDGFKDIASPRDEYVKLAKSSGGKGAGFIESQMQKADTYSKDVVSSNNKANLTKLSNSNKPTNTVPADSGLKPLSEVLSDNPIAQNNIKAALAYKDMYRKASTLPSDISVTDFIENSPVTKAMKSQYDDADLDQLGKERGTYDITMNGLDNYRAAYATTRQKHKAELNKQFGSGTFDKVENDLNTIYVALNNLGEPKTDKQKEIYNGYIKKIQGIKDSHKDMMDSPAFKEIQGLDSRLSEADQLEAKVEEETPVYQEHRKLVDKIQSQVDSEDGSHIRSYTDAVLRSSMRTADRVLDAIGAATNNDSMRERARVGMEMNPAATYNKRNLRDDLVDIDGKTYVVGPKSQGDSKLVFLEEKTSNGSFVPLPKDMQGQEVPANAKPYSKLNPGSIFTSVVDVASDMLVTSAITASTAGLGMLTAKAVGGVAALRKIQNVGKITSAMSNVNSLTKKSQYLGSILGNGLQAIPGYVDRATKEGTSEDDLLLGKLTTGLLYGIESNLNPVELKLTDKIFGLGEKTMSKTLTKFLNGEIKLADILVHTGKTLGKSVLGENIEENILEPFIDEGVSKMNSKLYDHDYESSFPTRQEIETTVATTTIFSILTGGITGNFSKNSLIEHSAKVLMEDKAGTLKILDLLESNNPEKFTDNLSKIRDVVKQVEAAGLSKKAETELTTLLFNRTVIEQKKTDADNQVSSFKYDKQLEGIDARIQSLISSNTTTAVNQATPATPATSSTPNTGNTDTNIPAPATGENKAKPAVSVKSDDTHTTLTVNGDQGEATFRKTNNGRTWSSITQDEDGKEVVTKLPKSFVDDFIKPKLEEAKQNEREAVAKSVEDYNTGKEKLIEGVDKSTVSTEEVTTVFDHIGDMIDEGTSPDEIKAVLDEATNKKGVANKIKYIQQKLGNKLPDGVLYSIKQMLSGSKEGILGLHSLGDMVQFHEKNTSGRTANINPNSKVTANEVTTKTNEIAELKKQKTTLEQQRKGFLNKDSKKAKAESLALTGKIEELSGQIKSKNQELVKAKKSLEISNKLNNSKQVEVTDIDKVNSDIAAIDTELSSVRSDKKASIESNPDNYEPGKTSEDTDKLSAKERDLVERKKKLEAIKKELEGDNEAENEMVSDVSYPKNAKPSNKKSSFSFKKNKTISTPNGSYTYLGKSKNENGRVFHSFKMDNGFTARLYEDTHIKSLEHLFDNSNSNVSAEAKNTLKKSAEIATENAQPKTPSESFIKSVQRGIRSIKARRLAKKLNKVFPGVSLSFDNEESLHIITRFDHEQANKIVEQDKRALVLADNNVKRASDKFIKTGSKVAKANLDKALKAQDAARETVNESIRKANKIVENYENSDFKQIKSADGTITLGFYDPSTGTIHLDENSLDYETPIHEFGHIWNIFARAQYPELYAKGLELIQGSEYHKEILNNPAYSHLSAEEVLDEALATAIGRAGADILSSNKRNSFLTFLNDLFSAIGEAIGFKSAANTSKKSFQDITLSEFINGVADEMLNGDIKNEGDIDVMQKYGDIIFNKIFEPDNSNQSAILDKEADIKEKLNRFSKKLDDFKDLRNISEDERKVLKEKLKYEIDALPNDMYYFLHETSADIAPLIFNEGLMLGGNNLVSTAGGVSKETLYNVLADLIDGNIHHKGSQGAAILAFPYSEFGTNTANSKVSSSTIEAKIEEENGAINRIPPKYVIGFFADGVINTESEETLKLTQQSLKEIAEVKTTSTASNQNLKRSAISSKIKLDNFYSELVGLLPNDLDPNSKLLKLPSQSMHEFSDKDAPYKSQYEITQDIINSDLPESVKDDYHKLLNENIKAVRKAAPNNINDTKRVLSVQDNKELKSEAEREMLTNIAVSGGLSVSKVIDDFKNWIKTGISSFKNLVKEYAKVIGTTSLLFIHTPIAISEYTGPNDLRVEPSVGIITELFNREALANGQELNEKSLDKALSIWNKTGRAEIIIDNAFITGDTNSNLRAFADPDGYRNPKRPIKILANITDINDFIAELSHMVQFSSDPNWVSKERKYNNQQEYDATEYDREGSLEYDAHSIIEPLLMEYILNDTPIDSLLNEGGADWFGVNLSHMKKVVDANKLHDLLKDNTSNKQPAVRVTGLKRMAVSDNTNNTNNPADLMDDYLKERITKGLTPEYDAFVNDQIYNETNITPNYIKARYNNLVEKSPQKAYSNIANILNLPELVNGDLAKAIEKGNSIANRNLEAKGTKVTKGSLKEKASNDTTGFYEFVSKTADELSDKGYHTVLHDNFDSFANDVDAAGFDLSNALKNNVLVLGNTVHIFDKPGTVSSNLPAFLASNNIEGGLLSNKAATDLQKKIESKYIKPGQPKFGQYNEDIRKNAFSYDQPLAEKDVNGVNIKITEGLIEGEIHSGNRRKTYLLYADGKIEGKFYSVQDAEKVVDFISSNLVDKGNRLKRRVIPNELNQQVSIFGISADMVEPVSTLISTVFDGLKRDGLTNDNTVLDWVNIKKGSEQISSLKISGQDVKVKQINAEVVNGFYSPLEKTIADTKLDKLPIKQWIEKFGKGEEAKWTGLADWLNQQQGSVSKADIQQYLKDNRIQVVEVVKGEDLPNYKLEIEPPTELGADRMDLLGDLGKAGNLDNPRFRDYLNKKYGKNGNKIYDWLVENATVEGTYSKDTKFSQYQLEGQKYNYKEILVTMPAKKTEVEKKINDFFTRMSKKYGENFVSKLTPEENRERVSLSMGLDVQPKNIPFKSSHFDEPNILVHLRMNTRTDANGNKVLFLEEVQSDWGQKGKKEGFDSKDIQRKELEKRGVTFNKNGTVSLESQDKFYEKGETWDLIKKYNDTYTNRSIVPQAPFVTDTNAWVKLGLKVALKEAVNQGADKIAWTTGEQQNDRYGLSKQVDSVYSAEYSFLNEKSNTYIDSKDIEIKLSNGSTKRLISSNNGEILDGEFIGEKLDNLIGKELAQKVLNVNGDKLFEGVDLKIGGKGMKGFYGSPTEGSFGIVGNVSKSLFKQEPKTVEIETDKNTLLNESYAEEQPDGQYKIWNGEARKWEYDLSKEIAEKRAEKLNKNYVKKNTSTQHSIDITPELKASVEVGQPLFKKEDKDKVQAQYRIESNKNIIEAVNKFNGSPEAVVALTHEIMHPTVVAIIDGAKEGNKVGSKYSTTIVEEFNKANPNNIITLEELIQGNEGFKNGNTDEKYRAVQEFIAESWEKYHKTGGKGFSTALQNVLDRISEAFKSVYRSLSGSNLTPELQKMFDEILGKKFTVDENNVKNNTKAEIKVKTLGLTMSDNPFKFIGLTELLVQQSDKDNIQNTIASDEFIKALSNVKNADEDKKLQVLETLNKSATSDSKLNIEDIPAIVDELVRLAEKSKDIPLPFVNYGEMESIEIAIDHSPKLKRSAKGPGKVDRGDTRIDDIKTAINKHREIPPEVWRAILSTPDKNGELPLSGRAFNEVISLATSNYKASIAQAQSLKTDKVLKVLKNGSVIADMVDFNNSVVDSDRILTQDFLKEVANIAEESPGMIKPDGRFPDVGSSVPKFTFMEVLDDVRHHNLHNIEQGSATANKIENNVLVSKSEVVGLGFALNTIFGTIQSIQGRIDDGDLSPQDLKTHQNELYIWKEHYRIMHNAFLKIGSETGGMLAIFRRKLVSIVEQDPMFFKNTLLTDPAIKNNKKLSRDVGALADEVTVNKAEVERLTNKGDEYNVINKTADEVFLNKKKEIESAAKVDNTEKIDSIVEQLISIARSNMSTDQARTAISDPNRIKRAAISGTPFNADMESSKRSALLYDLGVALMEQYPNRVLTFEDLTEIIQTKMGSQGKSVTAAEVRVAFASTHKDVIQRTVDIKRKQLEDVKKQARIITKLGTLLEGMALDKTHVTINNTVFYQVPTGPDSYVNKWVKSELVGGTITQVDANAAEEALIQKEVNKIGVTITHPVHTAGVPKLFIRVSDPSNLGNYWADSKTMDPATETEKSLISKQIKKDTSASKLGIPSLHKSAVILDANNNKHLFIITEEGKWVTVSNPLTDEMREATDPEMALIHDEVAKKGPYTEIQKLLVDLLKHSSSMNTIMGTAQQAAFLNHILQIKEEIPGALSGLTIDNSTIDRMLAKVTNMKELASLDKLENTKKAVEKSIETLLAGDDKKAIAEILAKAMKPDVPHQSREVILAKQRLRESQASLNKIIQGATRDKYKSNFRKFRLLTQTFKGLPASGDLSAHLIQGIAVSIKNIFYFNYWKGAKSVLKGGPLSDFISDRQKLVAKGNKHSITSFGKNGLAKASEFYDELTQHPYYAKMVQAGLGLSDPSVVDDPAEDLFREDLLDELNSMVIDKIDRNLTGNTAKAAKVATKLLTGTTIKQTSEASYLSTLNAHRAAMFISYMDSQKALNRPTTAASEEQAARSINDLTMKSSKIGSLNLNRQLEVAGYFLWAPKMYLAATKFVPNLLWKPIAFGKQVYTSREVNNELTKLGKLKAAIQSVGTRTTEEQKLIDNFRDKNNLPVSTSSDANVEEKILMDINDVKGKLVESQAMQGALRFSAFEHYSSLASIVGLNLTVLAMLKRFCKEPDTAGIQLDPTESSFLKVGCGGIYRDLTGNLSGYIKTTLQFSAKVMDYWGSSPVMKGNSYYNESTPGSILYEFYSRKLSPAFSMVSNTAFNMDFYGQPIHRPLMGFDDLIPAVGESINYSLSGIEPLVFRELLNISNNTYDINGLLGYMNPTFLDNLNTFKNDPMLRAVAIPSTIVITAMGASLKERNTYDIKSVVKDKASKYDINFGNRNDQINFEPPSAKGIMAIAKGEREAEKLTLNKDKFMYNKCKNLIVNTAEPFIRNMLDKIDKGDIDQITAKREIIAEVDRIKKDVEQYYKNEGMEWGYERIYRQKAMIIAKDAEQIKALDPKNAEKTGTFPGDKSYVDLVFNRNNLKVDPDILKLVNDAAKEEMIKQGFVKYGAKPQPLVGKLRY